MLRDVFPSVTTENQFGLRWLVSQLDALDSVISEVAAKDLLSQARLTPQQIAPYVEPRPGSYARRSIVRREKYELLVLTWMPGQGSVAHDHSGSLCGLKVAQGHLTEQLYACGPDGQVRATTANQLETGEITVDPGVVVHALGNSAGSAEVLVTVHLYSPPLPEVRRYAVATTPPAPAFLRQAPGNASVVVIIGGGFTGTMTLANLLRRAHLFPQPVRIVMIDRQPAVGEGIAYRTNDPRHLLNVPVEKMSAWPDQPNDFLNFAGARDPSVKPGDFLPRKLYGQYVRHTFLQLANTAPSHVSIEMIRDDAVSLTHAVPAPGWVVGTARGRTVQADLAIVTLGHRPPAEEFVRRWKGPRTRFISDPWAALVLSQIGPDEPVLVLGSGLTAMDAILTLDRSDRTAPITVVSRRGLMPHTHPLQPKAPCDVSQLLARWLDPSRPLKVREMLRELRQSAENAASNSIDWRQIIDGLRPSIARIWERIATAERARFLRHVRPFWEIHRHRMAPSVVEKVTQLRARKILDLTAGALAFAEADGDGIDVTLNCRGSLTPRKIRVSWVINCTGPGIHDRRSTHPILRSLIESELLCEDPLGLGFQTDANGHAIAGIGKVHTSLFIAGTLRKSTLWESTAVPELRQQAALAADVALQTLNGQWQI